MIQASIGTIGDEILIGQIIDTNSAHIAAALEEAGIHVSRKTAIADDPSEILHFLQEALSQNEIVITTGGLGPTKDDITKAALARFFGSQGYREDPVQAEIIRNILHSRGLEYLPSNQAQALVPEGAEVIPNRLGTAPILVFRFPLTRFSHPATLYALPGVPHEAIAALPAILQDIRAHQQLDQILHHSVMVYGMAESALAEKIAAWENALPQGLHLAYLPNTLTGIRLRLSAYGGDAEELKHTFQNQLRQLKALLGDLLYSEQDDCLESVIGEMLKRHHKTLSAAESCTGGEISQLLTSVPGSSAYYLGSVTSYAISVKEEVLGVPHEIIERFGVVSSEVAAAMAEGVRRLMGSDYAVATTGLSGPGGDGIHPVGTVWIGVAGPQGTHTETHCYKNDRKRNIERFAATALNALRLMLLRDLGENP